MSSHAQTPLGCRRRRRKACAGAGALLLAWALPTGAGTDGSAALPDLLGDTVWTADAARLGWEAPVLGFRWQDNVSRDALRAVSPPWRAFGAQPVEAVLWMREDAPRAVEILLYSRGDSGAVSEESFDGIVRKVRAEITEWAGSPGFPQKPSTLHASDATVERHVWIGGQTRADLEWSARRLRPPDGGFAGEFVRVCLQAADPAHRALVAAGNAPAGRIPPSTPRATLPARIDLAQRVHKRPDESRVIAHVPMVNQGRKGYCVAATIERIMRYYGRSFGQHEVAEAAGTSATDGTSPELMINALRRMSSRLGIRIQVLVDFDADTISRTLRNYNREARKARATELTAESAESLNALFGAMDPQILRSSRAAREGDCNRFFADVRRHVDAGIPMSWALMVGLMPESGLTNGVYGHMRIITGYNAKTREIVFSDSWGPGHEEKRIPLADAWAVTLGLYAIMPSDIRP